jgi:hypothetical protein
MSTSCKFGFSSRVEEQVASRPAIPSPKLARILDANGDFVITPPHHDADIVEQTPIPRTRIPGIKFRKKLVQEAQTEASNPITNHNSLSLNTSPAATLSFPQATVTNDHLQPSLQTTQHHTEEVHLHKKRKVMSDNQPCNQTS